MGKIKEWTKEFSNLKIEIIIREMKKESLLLKIEKEIKRIIKIFNKRKLTKFKIVYSRLEVNAAYVFIGLDGWFGNRNRNRITTKDRKLIKNRLNKIIETELVESQREEFYIIQFVDE